MIFFRWRRTCVAAALAVAMVFAQGQRLMAADPVKPSPATGTVVISDCQIKVVDRALLAAERDGVIAEISVRDGQRVAAGAPLVRLKDETARRRAEVFAHRASNDINVRFSRVLAETARASYEAGLELEEQNALSAFQMRQRKLEYDRSVLSIEQSQHDHDLAKLEATQAQAELAEYGVTAPFAGAITRILKRRGESVVNGEAIIEIVNSDVVQVEGFADLNSLWGVAPDSPVRIQIVPVEGAELPAPLRADFAGRVVLIDEIVQPVSQRVRVVAELKNPGRILREGLLARMQIQPEPPAPDAPPAP